MFLQSDYSKTPQLYKSLQRFICNNAQLVHHTKFKGVAGSNLVQLRLSLASNISLPLSCLNTAKILFYHDNKFHVTKFSQLYKRGDGNISNQS